MTFPISRTGNVALNSSERVSRTLHFSPGRDTRSFMTANNLVFLFACLLFTMSSANLLSPSQQRRPLGEEHRTVWGRRGVLEQPGHVDPQGRQESSVSRCWDPPCLPPPKGGAKVAGGGKKAQNLYARKWRVSLHRGSRHVTSQAYAS